ncbi:MAG: DUF4388 domain-containing protein [Geobacter sp.]|nr:MAG: DUF4388 domain-containing protein [Geobacter sp.]
MSFTGDLEHLPIVDIIQLLHATRKSGILRVRCRKGESELVFKDGYMVSANHLNNSVRIGKILSDLNLITPEILDQALQEQLGAGPCRKPLIITLLEKGHVKEEDAYKGLEQLIEMTIVEILTWKKGTFILDVLPEGIADEYRYYPDKMGREVNINTQSVLMDALRIYDEKIRDGELPDEDFDDYSASGDPGGQEESAISADDLGLADFDLLERKIPAVFKSLDQGDPFKLHCRKIEEAAPELSPADRELLASFLVDLAAASTVGAPSQESPTQPVIFFSADEVVRHALTTVCKHAGILVFATDEEENIDPIIAQSLARNSMPLLVLDTPGQSDAPLTADTIALLQQKKSRYPQMAIIQLAPALSSAFSLQAYGAGVSAVFPRPMRQHDRDSFVAELIDFLEAFRAHLKERAREQGHQSVRKLAASIKLLHGLTEPSEIATALLQFVGGVFERALTLIVRESEIVVEKSVGIKGEKSGGIEPAMGLRIPLPTSSLLSDVIREGRIFCGNNEDETILNNLFTAIGAPDQPTVLLLPIRNQGKSVAITYADFGNKAASPVDLEVLGILTAHAELVLENSLLRKKILKTTTQKS